MVKRAGNGIPATHCAGSSQFVTGTKSHS